MKRPARSIAALAVFSVISFADQPAGPPPGGPPRGPPIERIAQDLGLDATQSADMKRILEAQHAKMDAERQQLEANGTRPSREEMHARHEQMEAELHQQLAAVLTAEQLTKFEEMHRHRGPSGPPPGERSSDSSGQQ